MRRNQSGFVLISILWIVLFLALAAATFTLSVRTHVRETSAETTAAQAKVLAEAGIELALHDLVNARQLRTWQRRFPPDGRIYACSMEGGRVLVTTEDEAGRIDLNAAPEALLSRLIAGLGVEQEEARRHAAAIVDYRDRDDRGATGGNEADDYARAGRPLGPKNAPFDSTAELAQVAGFDSSLVARLQPFVGVHSGLPGIDPTKASPALLRALGDAEDAAGSTRLDAEHRAISPQRVYRITSSAITTQGARHARQAVVYLAPTRARNHAMLAWQRVDATQAPPHIDHGPC